MLILRILNSNIRTDDIPSNQWFANHTKRPASSQIRPKRSSKPFFRHLPPSMLIGQYFPVNTLKSFLPASAQTSGRGIGNVGSRYLALFGSAMVMLIGGSCELFSLEPDVMY